MGENINEALMFHCVRRLLVRHAAWVVEVFRTLSLQSVDSRACRGCKNKSGVTSSPAGGPLLHGLVAVLKGDCRGHEEM